jgi:hypothetical protein
MLRDQANEIAEKGFTCLFRQLMFLGQGRSKTGSSSAAILDDPEVGRLTRDLSEAREQQTATSAVDSLEAFDQALQRIRLIKGILNSETSLLLSTHKT